MKLHRTVLALAVLALCTHIAPVNAAVLPVHAAPPPLGITQTVVHRFFGVLRGARGSMLVLGLRNGQSLTIDASAAFALGRVSSPLFIGKALVVTGRFAAGNLLEATIIKRAAPRMASWDIDR